MTSAELHARLDTLESVIDEELKAAKAEHARRLDMLRALKSKAASMRVALAMERGAVTGGITEINRFKGVA